MRITRLSVVVAFVAVALAGCSPDSVYVEDAATKAPFDGQLVVGEKADVRVTVSHPEIEGSSTLDAARLETSDINVVRTEIGGQGFFLHGVGPGTATIHATTDGFPSADFVVTVVAAR